MVPSLVAFDVDGTLMDSDGVFRNTTAAALERLRALGVPIVLATGRPWRVVEATVAQVGGAEWAVCSNGSKLVEVATGRVHRNAFLPDAVPRTVVETIRVRLPGTGFGLEFEDGAIAEAGWSRRLPPGIRVPDPVDDVLELLDGRWGPVRGVTMFHDDFDDAPHELADAVAPHVDGLGVDVRSSGLPFVSLGLAGEHKARALQTLVEVTGLSPADAVAFGDETNDVEMFRWAGLGVAMGNARADVRQHADLIAPTNDDDGVAAVLDRLLNGFGGLPGR